MGLAGRAKTLAKRLLGRGGDADPSGRAKGEPLPAAATLAARLRAASACLCSYCGTTQSLFPQIYTLRLQMAER